MVILIGCWLQCAWGSLPNDRTSSKFILSLHSLFCSLFLCNVLFFTVTLCVLCACSSAFDLDMTVIGYFPCKGELEHLKFSQSVTTRGDTHRVQRYVVFLQWLWFMLYTHMTHKQQIIPALFFITDTVLCLFHHTAITAMRLLGKHTAVMVFVYTGLWAVFLFLAQSADELWQ